MAEDLYDKTRREYLESEARLQREYARQAAELGTDPELLRLKFENPHEFAQAVQRATQQHEAVQAELVRIRGAKEQLKREAEQRNAALEGADPAGPSADRQRLQDALARLMKQRAGK